MGRFRIEIDEDLYNAFEKITTSGGESERRYVGPTNTAEQLVEAWTNDEFDIDMMSLDDGDQLSEDDLSRVMGQLRSISDELEECSEQGTPDDEELDEILDEIALTS